MAQRTVVILEDDLDGGDASETIAFGLDGAAYEIDVNEKNAAAIRDALAPFIAAGRKVGGKRSRRTASPASKGEGASPAEIRAWAQSQGMDVPARGRIPAEVREAWDAR